MSYEHSIHESPEDHDDSLQEHVNLGLGVKRHTGLCDTRAVDTEIQLLRLLSTLSLDTSKSCQCFVDIQLEFSGLLN